MGLALGTGLSLMILTRFRSEEAAITGSRNEATVAASAAVSSTGRAVLIAGTGLFAALFLASVIGPTDNLHSIGTGVTRERAAGCRRGGCRDAGRSDAARRPHVRRKLWSPDADQPAVALALYRAACAAACCDRRRGGNTRARRARDPRARHQDRTRLTRNSCPPIPGAPGLRGDPAGDGPRLAHALQHRCGLRPRADHGAQDAAAAGALPGAAREGSRASTPLPGPGLFRAKTADLGTLKTKLDESNKLLKGAGPDLGRLEGGLGKAGAGAVQLRGGLSEAAAGASQLQGGGATAQDGARQAEGRACRRPGRLGKDLRRSG